MEGGKKGALISKRKTTFIAWFVRCYWYAMKTHPSIANTVQCSGGKEVNWTFLYLIFKFLVNNHIKAFLIGIFVTISEKRWDYLHITCSFPRIGILPLTCLFSSEEHILIIYLEHFNMKLPVLTKDGFT